MTAHAEAERSSSADARSAAESSKGSQTGAMADALNSRPAVQSMVQLKSALGAGRGVAQFQGGGIRGLLARMAAFSTRHLYGPHRYAVRNRAFPQGLPDMEKYAALKRYPAPGARDSSEEGAEKWMALGRIHTQADPEDLSITNRTLPPHILHNYLGGKQGVVKRRVEGEDIVTEGEGSGILPSLNEALAPYIWGPQAYKARLETDPQEREYQEMISEEMRKASERE